MLQGADRAVVHKLTINLKSDICVLLYLNDEIVDMNVKKAEAFNKYLCSAFGGKKTVDVISLYGAK